MKEENSQLENRIVEIAERHELNSILEEVKNINSNPIKTKVAFLGEFSSGKTSLINALIKEKFLPMFDKPTTAIITEIVNGDSDKFEIIEEVDGKKEIKEIAAYQIAAEVQKEGVNKKMVVSLANSSIVDNNTILIDTPGVSSLNETHTDITYGYLEFVDVAFVVLNINTGSASKSLLHFLEQIPKDLLSKIFFILNFTDTKSNDQIEKLREEFNNSLAAIIEDPAIYLTSAKRAIQANDNNDEELLQKSGIIPIYKIITEEIPAFHNEIQEKRRKEKLYHLKEILKEGLNNKLNYMEYDEEEYFREIEKLKANISELESSQKIFKDKLRDIEKSTRRDLHQIADNYTASIIYKMTEGLDITPETSQLASEIEFTLKNRLQSINNFEMQEIGENLTQNVTFNLKYNFDKTFSIANKIPGLINSAILAAATGGAGLAMNTAETVIAEALGTGIRYAENKQKKSQTSPEIKEKTATSTIQEENKVGTPQKNINNKRSGEDLKKGDEKNDNTKVAKNKSSKFKKGVLLAGTIIAKLDLIGDLKDITMKKAMYNKVNRRIINTVDSQCNLVFAGVHDLLDQEMTTKFVLPLRTETESLASVRKNRDAEKNKIKEDKELIKKDLLELKIL